MFKKGDRIIYIGEHYKRVQDNNGSDFFMKKNSQYIFFMYGDSSNIYMALCESLSLFETNDFISLAEQRKQKLQEICLSQETELN